MSSGPGEMDRRRFLRTAGGVTGGLVVGEAGLWSLLGSPEQALLGETVGDLDLERVFANPPEAAAPWAIWHWLNANVTAEGISADLEAMRANGIAGAVIFSIGKRDERTLVDPPADPLSPLWWSLVQHAVTEAARLGLKLGMQICDGWATAGGPWITPELSMQQVVWAEETIEGGRPFTGVLLNPPAKQDYYRDIAVLAFPLPSGWDETSETRLAKVTTNLSISDISKVFDGSNGELAVDTDQQGWIQFEFAEPFTARSITMRTPSFNRPANSLEIQASEDGAGFRVIGSLETPRHGWQTNLRTLTHAVPETTARFFRFVYHPGPARPFAEDMDKGVEPRLKLASIVMSTTPRVHHLQGKSAVVWAASRRTTDAEAPPAVCVPLERIVDLTDRMSPDGTLRWQIPAGRWRVLRIGHTSTGETNDPAGAARGLECDKFNPEAAKVQFDGWFGEGLRRAGPALAGKVLHVLNIDSWEARSQNWSPVFRDEFRRRRGYDLLCYLPAMAGVPVESADVTERFLLDIRRTVAELLHDNFFAPIQRLAHERGCILTAECTAPTMQGDGMLHYRSVDIPTAEFWLNTPQNDKPTDIKEAVSGSRMYSKPIAMAEAFTQVGLDFSEHPFTLKALGDHHFCEGINKFLLHVWAHQPYPDRAPGLQLFGEIGTFFSGSQTWWKPGKAWFDYIRRCQALLQCGQSVADVLYFTGDEIPARALLPAQLDPPLPPGYAYDSINRDALLRLARVRDGRITVGSGAGYRVLVLPNRHSLTPEVVEKIREFVAAGATVVGPRPELSPSLEQYPACDAQVRRIAERAWRRGGVISAKSLDAVLMEMSVLPDVEVLPAPHQIEWIHRRGDRFDLYFLSNQAREAVSVELSFRVSGRVPELWRPDTGKIDAAAAWSVRKSRTIVPLELDPAGSVFVVFRKRASSRARTATRAEQRATALAVEDPWTVRLPVKGKAAKQVELARLESLSNHADPDVRFFSGTASYTTTFTMPATHGSAGRMFLDLGEVANLAEVMLNGHELGVLWKPPFMVEVTVREGLNQLQVDVTNTWRNRLIGDAALLPEERATWLPGYKLPLPPDASLLPAGLLGPVRLVRSVQKTAH